MNCKEITNNKIIVLIDKDSKASSSEMRFKNLKQREITKRDLDYCRKNQNIKTCEYKTNEVCPIKINEKSCDYLIIDESGTEYFVELKGNKVLDACEQIEKTIKKLSKNYPNEKPFFAFIIPVSVSPKINPTIQNWRSKMRTKYKCTLIVQNKSFEQELN